MRAGCSTDDRAQPGRRGSARPRCRPAATDPRLLARGVASTPISIFLMAETTTGPAHVTRRWRETESLRELSREVPPPLRAPLLRGATRQHAGLRGPRGLPQGLRRRCSRHGVVPHHGPDRAHHVRLPDLGASRDVAAPLCDQRGRAARPLLGLAPRRQAARGGARGRQRHALRRRGRRAALVPPRALLAALPLLVGGGRACR